MEEIRIMVDHEAFLMGIKPALCRQMIPQLEELMPQLEKYPYMIDEDGTYLFFQNQELMNNYLARLSNIEWGSSEYHRLLGLTLGYPPSAVEFFLDKLTDHSLYQYSVNVGYAGYRFVAHVSDLHHIIDDMWNQHKVEEKTRLGVGSELYYIGYRDYEELQKFVTEVRRELVAGE
ncbi:hypothetical protein [Thermoactinomyces mirandus]|uniref:Uncharacterized protein n=1 Tax=Thermoactinomyces mirandus TaxID=2756294 RepID=A0A7W1XUK6_9BACL|nr:hypothetical protein [Thermoactinomyces mirandus]MBA4603525.1 hypothetical protein [Thermoactinomyces mirandus]